MVSRRIRILAGALIGFLMVAALVAYAGPRALLEAVLRADPVFVVAAVVAYAGFFVARGLRWRVLLQPAGVDASASGATALTAFGWLVSTYVPFKAGDVARTAMLARRQKADVARVGGTVVVERALDMMGLALLASGALLVVGLLAPAGLPTWLWQAFLAASLLPVLGLGLLWWLGRKTPPGSDGNWFVRTGRSFLSGVRALGKTPRAIPDVALLTVLVVVTQALVFVFLVRAFVPEASALAVVVGVPIFLLSFVVAVTPGHVGTYEAAFVAVFALFGLDPATLVGAAVLTHVVTAGIATALGGVGYAYLHATGDGPRKEDVGSTAAEGTS